ncbi:methylase involved in ubiquinone/menaquinone biosynthesis [Salinarchaeum sp. Harcht-Bsk1]|uniref:class I SAM-dependent methyltransferase n=1 Tax=Salinarchaeum sp. Harcht-Bsk1 TaxID=1333523 RepID=UPI0003424549|nr:methyltransferase domain-containing protein [Salinarchaeum sp. Harcht-Bsk1]AGN00570.1 methylase involved in ubiquinone/menaquinone biosynthesis [Salinarchaeum sp. Harcht-Bsk1]
MSQDSAYSRSSTLGHVRDVYADQASTFARFAFLNRLLSGRYRRRAFESAEGAVLDVACGLGTNRGFVPNATEYTGIDVSPEMIEQAAKRHDDLERGEDLYEMDAQDLDFPDDSFDTVISSLSTCTFPDPHAALSEMHRVCRPDGQVLLLEHGRSSVWPIAKFQDWRAEAHFEKHACRWTQEPLEIVEDSPLTVESHWTALFGILTGVEARTG